jgi:hypothetical protein
MLRYVEWDRPITGLSVDPFHAESSPTFFSKPHPPRRFASLSVAAAPARTNTRPNPKGTTRLR